VATVVRTPVVESLPALLEVRAEYPRTPIVDGRTAVSFEKLILSSHVDERDLSVTLRLAEVCPSEEPLWQETKDDLLAASLAFFCAEMLSGPPDKPYNGRFLIGSHHIDWDEAVNSHDRLLIEAARDHGKCRVAGSLVQAADGRRIPVEKWTGGEVIAYDAEHYKLLPARATPSKLVGKTKCFRITTRTGRTETVADWHRFATVDGWVHAEDAKVGQRIAVPKTLPTLASQRWTPGLAWLLGLMLGDGCLVSNGSCGLTIGDDATVDAACNAAAESGWELTGEGQQFRLTNRWSRVDCPTDWLRELGVLGYGAHEKHIPEEVFELDNAEIADLIAGLIDSDGNVNDEGGGAVELYSVSKRLLQDVLHLLTRLGVVSVLSRKRGRYNGEEHLSWRLTVRGESICRLAKHVRPRGAKGARLARLADQQAAKDEGGSIDLLPKSVYSWLTHGKDWMRRRGGPRFEKQYDLTRSKARVIGQMQGNARLRDLANAEILWDEIAEIEDVGEQEVYALQVPKYETYVGQDIINHNSHFWSLGYPIWMAGWVRPKSLGYIISSSQETACDLLNLVKEELLNNPKLAHLVPKNTERRWSKSRIVLANGSVIRARGMGVRLRGAHPQWIVCDDCLSDDDIYSATIRRRTIDFFLSAISNMVVPGGSLIVVGTPMHYADLYGYLRGTGRYWCRKYPAIDKFGVALFPERYDRESLRKKQQEIGTARFAREFLCQPLSDEASMFPSKLFEGGDVLLPYRMGLPAAYWEERGWVRYTGVDFAMSTSASADWTVIFTVAVDTLGNRWVVSIRRGQGWGFHKQLDIIKEEYVLYRPDVITVESNQFQRIFTDELIRETDMPIRRFFTAGVQPKQPWRKGMSTLTMGKHHLDRGVPSLRMSLENRKWRWPRGDAESIELTDYVFGELQAMSFQDGRVVSVGDHDDTVMAMWMTDVSVRMGGFRFSFGEEGENAQSPMANVPPPMVTEQQPTADKQGVAEPDPGQYGHANAAKADHAPDPHAPDDDWPPREGAPSPADLGFGGIGESLFRYG
jgi:hypothetical protein